MCCLFSHLITQKSGEKYVLALISCHSPQESLRTKVSVVSSELGNLKIFWEEGSDQRHENLQKHHLADVNVLS